VPALAVRRLCKIAHLDRQSENYDTGKLAC
jgi:hypothetical protein